MSIRMGNEPQVTVICTAYNHEKYIETALDSFVAQQTSFPFRIYVSDDKSHDRTTGIVRAYAERYPDIVVPFIREYRRRPKLGGHDLPHLCSLYRILRW